MLQNVEATREEDQRLLKKTGVGNEEKGIRSNLIGEVGLNRPKTAKTVKPI